MPKLRPVPPLILALALAACGQRDVAPPEAPTPEPLAPEAVAPAADMRLAPTDFESIAGWEGSDRTGAIAAFRRSCAVLAGRDPNAPMSARAPQWGAVAEWLPACAALPPPDAASPDVVRAFFEGNFIPLRAATPQGETGLLTGYYEPELAVTSSRTTEFSAPLQGPPPDLIRVDLGAFDTALAGQQIVGKIQGQALVPYDERATITPERAPILAWGRPVDVFFLQVQGSGLVAFPDGTRRRAAFAAHNGRPYRSIGSVLIARGELTADAASKAGIETWIAAHPDQAQALFNENPRFVFFALEPAGSDLRAGPRGAQGAPLTAEASMAVDPAFLPYGAPVWITASIPGEIGDWRAAESSRLVIAQDTGGAITGPLRGDLFFGSGDFAGSLAGSMRSQARWIVLAPPSVAERLIAPDS